MKHPVSQSKTRLTIWWLVWFLVGLGQSVLFYFAYGSFLDIIPPDIVLSLTIYSGIALLLWYPFRFFNTSKTSIAVLISNLIGSGVITVSLWIIIIRFLMLHIFPENNHYQAYWEATFPYRVGTGVFIYGMVILAYYLFESLSNLAEKNAREARLESLVKETELKMLRSQINPHFLFNSLNSISSLTITDPEKARTMVVKLSEFMRYALSRKDEQPVSFESELINLRLYLDIEKTRFGERLITEENIQRYCLEIKIPAMLLQPLYENAIKHGVYESTGNVKIVTEAKIEKGFLEIKISNDYDQDSAPIKGTGTGLLNVFRRLELFYGNKGLISTKKEDGIFTVQLFIPINNQS